MTKLSIDHIRLNATVKVTLKQWGNQSSLWINWMILNYHCLII